MNLGLWRVISIEVFLTIGYDALVKASMRITEEILRQWGSADATFHILWGDGPLKYLVPTLSSLLTTESHESNALETTKSKQEPKIVQLPFSTPRPTCSDGGERPSTPTETQQCPPQSYQTPVNQRTASGSSFGPQSTETTPNKLVHAEPKVQALQNKFVECI